MNHSAKLIRISESWTCYDFDSDGENVTLDVRELYHSYFVDGKEYKYAVGITVYSRNYNDEWVESPTLFATEKSALEFYNNELNRLYVKDDLEEIVFNEV